MTNAYAEPGTIKRSKRPAQMANAMGWSDEFIAGQPVARRKEDVLNSKAFGLGFASAKNLADRAALERDQAAFAQEQAQLLQMLMMHQMQMNGQIAAAQEQGAYQGAYQATGDHLGDYSGQLAGMLSGGQGGMAQAMPM